jgi:hypothetical protein
VKDVKNGIENTISGPAIVMKVDPVVAARAGFTPQEIELDASAILQGEPATTPVVVNDRVYDSRAVSGETRGVARPDPQHDDHQSSTGKTATLGSLAEFSDEAGQTKFGARICSAMSRSRAASKASAWAKEWRRCRRRWRFAPAARDSRGLRRHLCGAAEIVPGSAVVLVLAVVLVFTVLLFEFRNFAAPVAILASALLSTSGVFLALLITGTTFNISSFMGLIMVIGIVAKNGILLLDADQRFRAEGSARDAHDRGGRAAAAAHPDDRAGDHGGHDSAVARDRRGLADAAAAGDRGDRRHSGVDGAVADRDAGGICHLAKAAIRAARYRMLVSNRE